MSFAILCPSCAACGGEPHAKDCQLVRQPWFKPLPPEATYEIRGVRFLPWTWFKPRSGPWSQRPSATPLPDSEPRHPPRPTPAAAHRVRVDMAAVQLRNMLRRQAEGGCATPSDTQLLAALDRWSAGDLI